MTELETLVNKYINLGLEKIQIIKIINLLTNIPDYTILHTINKMSKV